MLDFNAYTITENWLEKHKLPEDEMRMYFYSTLQIFIQPCPILFKLAYFYIHILYN